MDDFNEKTIPIKNLESVSPLSEASDRINSADQKDLSASIELLGDQTQVASNRVQVISDLIHNTKTQVKAVPLAVSDEAKVQKKIQDLEWFLGLPAQERVDKSYSLIMTKQKNILDVVEMFLLANDMFGLDNLEGMMSLHYDELVQQGVLPKL